MYPRPVTRPKDIILIFPKTKWHGWYLEMFARGRTCIHWGRWALLRTLLSFWGCARPSCTRRSCTDLANWIVISMNLKDLRWFSSSCLRNRLESACLLSYWDDWCYLDYEALLKIIWGSGLLTQNVNKFLRMIKEILLTIEVFHAMSNIKKSILEFISKFKYYLNKQWSITLSKLAKKTSMLSILLNKTSRTSQLKSSRWLTSLQKIRKSSSREKWSKYFQSYPGQRYSARLSWR